MNVALTGGIGCGKSTVLKLLQERGAMVAETDLIARRILMEDAEVGTQLRELFGEGIYDPQGKVDRVKLASMVFPDPQKLRSLELLLHPRVRAEWKKLTAEGYKCLIVEIPLLYEKALESHFDLTLCVAAHPQLCQERLLKRGLSEEQIKQRQANQLPLSEKMERADLVILNDGPLSSLIEQIDALLPRLGLAKA